MKFSNILATIFFISLLGIGQLYAQDEDRGIKIKRADKFYNAFDFENAIEVYKTAVDGEEPDLYVMSQIGNCYKYLNQIEMSEDWYGAVAISAETDPIFKFNYAQALMANGKYPEALDAMNDYYSSIGRADKVVTEYSKEIFELDTKYTVEIEDFNSVHADFSPYLVDDKLFFVSNRNVDVFVAREDVWSSRPFTQLFTLTLEEDTATGEVTKSSPKIFREDKVSKLYHEGPVCYDEKTNSLYFTRSNYSKKKAVKGVNDAVNLKIVKVIYNPEENTNIAMEDNTSFSDKDYSIAYPTITKDGQYMIFSSDMPGGYGGLDLYVAQLAGGQWTNYKNLGDKINTPGNESFPYITSRGVLYFSSNGHLGLGGLDLYASVLLDDGTFDTPQNLKAPLNSTFDDFGLYYDEESSSGYFTSRRPSEYGDDDIYSFEKNRYLFEAIVYDKETNERLDSAEVVLKNLDTGVELVMYTDKYGGISTEIDPYTRYKLDVSKDLYFPESAEFTTAEDDVYAEVPLVKDNGILLDVTVLDVDTKKEIPYSDVVLIDLNSAEEVPKVTNAYGKVQFKLSENREYRLKASKTLETPDSIYFSVSDDFNTFNVQSPVNLYTEMELKKQCLNCEIRIDNIYYDLDKYFIRADAAEELNKLVKTLSDNPTIHIELSSHTDCRGSEKYNTWLSAKRAESAVNYLIENGISHTRLEAAGYGETKLTNECACENGVGLGRTSCNEVQHQANRRTVFKITKY